MSNYNLQTLIFIFFVLGCTGWVLETVQETIVRRKFVNKGFFKGPFALCHAIGGVGVYIIGLPFKAQPLLVFAVGVVVCTVIEYSMAVFLEKCFKVKCWDYSTYPHTKWCHFQGRISLTLSIAFGLLTLGVVYVYWDFARYVASLLGNYILPIDIALVVLVLVDIVCACKRVWKANKAGIKIKGYAIFSSMSDFGSDFGSNGN